jgi:hypothetical protein
MRTHLKVVAIAALLAFGSAACNNWLVGPGVTQDPNSPTTASNDQRLVAVQAAMEVQLTGDLARTVCMWVQQCAGVQRQYSTRDVYNTTSTDFDTEFNQIWSGGGLVDMRLIESTAVAAGDSVYEGVAKVLEALDISTAADVWGDIPYSEAVSGVSAPHFDPQQSVYNATLNVLNQAIAELHGSGGPHTADLWLGGDTTKWAQFAHTLKARIYLHMAKQLGAGAYTNALNEAKLGIASSANDVTTYQSTTSTEWNMWYQFTVIQRSGYLTTGAELVDSIMNKRTDPRLPLYFAKDGNGLYQGAKPGDASDPTVQSDLAAARGGADAGQGFRQPLATHAENQLIIAEAAYQTGDPVTALDSLNAERTAAGLGTVPITVVGAALLDSIMIEKYVATFQNMEAWNDYKRTCIPALKPAGTATHVIGRFLYGSIEESANANAELDPASGRNWNDPSPC